MIVSSHPSVISPQSVHHTQGNNIACAKLTYPVIKIVLGVQHVNCYYTIVVMAIIIQIQMRKALITKTIADVACLLERLNCCCLLC